MKNRRYWTPLIGVFLFILDEVEYNGHKPDVGDKQWWKIYQTAFFLILLIAFLTMVRHENR